jgi:hypothetical protein
VSSKVEMIDQETIDVLEEENNKTEEDFIDEVVDILSTNEGE